MLQKHEAEGFREHPLIARSRIIYSPPFAIPDQIALMSFYEQVGTQDTVVPSDFIEFLDPKDIDNFSRFLGELSEVKHREIGQAFIEDLHELWELDYVSQMKWEEFRGSRFKYNEGTWILYKSTGKIRHTLKKDEYSRVLLSRYYPILVNRKWKICSQHQDYF